MKNNKIKKVSWKEYFELINKLGDILLSFKNRFDIICGIPRGGLIPAVILSHKFDKPCVDEGRALDAKRRRKKVLIVDDIADSGTTLKEHSYGDILVVLHYKPWSKVVPNIYVEKVPNRIWIRYPYESEGKEWQIDNRRTDEKKKVT